MGDHKTLYYDVEPFLFYVLTFRDSEGCHPRGYFSKEKDSPEKYNLACLLTFPAFQGAGYGRFLIQFSYLLSKREHRLGKPERPLSDLGLRGYFSYWKSAILEILAGSKAPLSVAELAKLTAIHPNDIVLTLNSLGLLGYVTPGQAAGGEATQSQPATPVTLAPGTPKLMSPTTATPATPATPASPLSASGGFSGGAGDHAVQHYIRASKEQLQRLVASQPPPKLQVRPELLKWDPAQRKALNAS
eukprot:NODE_1472_length_962_cov_141.613363_g1020_i0.p1 GENE.NODE_1472_length_962_cov_141.613363_g1020_i0~~NODE_1472_length_962_cov_141.613363_g1020_i0.p1  ORF type:complete len:260 (+),score=84.42 NODE_1472_length_962_cov_141.613363_g1020_i0:47-781(+)